MNTLLLRSRILDSITVVLFLLLAETVSADYLGELCWTLHVTERNEVQTDESYVVKFGVTHMGDDYYTLQGYALVDDPTILQAAAVVIGDTAHLHFSSSEYHPDDLSRDIAIGNARLSLTTLSGPFFGLNTFYDPMPPTFTDSLATGTMTLVECPQSAGLN
ncbi:MAG: hypothetical protein AB2728_19830 [Candidatus Thiodiazotropha sp.]|nr:hypothetical protein [Candidatus Thiodiazotropha taylori]MBT3057173.1 hypothetical protein [Candidatus Thiodiazotropha sp. (ex Lucina pensylvanica)]MBT3061284.1 hypothetical protein [Candidatus Thiodiazotropha sp. (ex Lucina pensylvanica)]PUB73697.1 MAG: hypothetical protein DBP03_12090 [gamma proteobacterium symbiont of Ctena orbiculata]PUB77646.1 MAG: hypothetical protein DBO99_09675 [gamma proteobacterium symbiont of Ctena orbiculata]